MRGPGILGGLLLALTAWTGSATAQGLIELAPGAELGGEYRGSWHRVAGRSERTGTDFLEWLQIPFAGRILGPRFLQYRVSLRPELRQSSFTGADQPLRGRQLAFGSSAELLPAAPVTLRFNAGRAAGSSTGGLGADNRFRYGSAGATAAWRNPVLPMQLGVTSQSSVTRLQSTPTSPEVRTAYRLRTLHFSGTSSKTALRYERTEFDDRETDADYSAWSGGLLHQFRWGKGSRLETGLERTDQGGSLQFDRREWFERLHLQHTRSASSELLFRRTRTESRGRSSRIESWSYQFSTRLHPGISAGLGASHAVGHFDGARDQSSGIAPRAGFDLAGPARTRVQGDVSAGVEWRRFTGGGVVTIQVADEAHSVGATRSFFLDEPDAQATSVVLRSAALAVVFLEGADYLLTPVGRELRVDIPPGSRIAVGDRLLASYRYDVPGDTDQRALDLSYHVAASRGGLRLDHSRSLRQGGDLPAALNRGVSNFDETRTRLLAHGTWREVRVDLEAMTERRERAGVARSEHGLGADFGIVPGAGLVTALGVRWSRSQAGDQRADALAARSTTTWSPRPTLQLHAGLEALLWRQTGIPDDRFLGVALDAVWYVVSLEAVVRYEYSRRTGPLDLNGHRLTSRLIRRL